MSNKSVATSTAKVDPALLPGTVVYSNEWTGLEGTGIGKLFKQITANQALALKPGDILWFDSEWPQGKVYGLCRGQVEKIKEYDDCIMIDYKGPHSSGRQRVPKSDGYHEVNICTDEQKLLEMIEANPLHIETGTVGTISPKSREYLHSIGSRIALRT
jgi:hypothetical protein